MIKNISDIEKNRMKDLIEFLNYHTKLYDEGHPQISDYEWDKKYFELERLEIETQYVLPASPTHKIKYDVVNELKKVKHNHPMLSADKTKDWNEFVNYFGDKDVVGMLKLDGLTGSAHYINGRLIGFETRGDGQIGEDILHNAKGIPSIPKFIDYLDELIIDGEIICTEENFKPFSEEYKNPRNFAAGSIRLLDANECSRRNLTFVAWNVVKGLTNNVLDNFTKLKKLGFTVTPYTSSFDWDAKDFLIYKSEELGYPIDGIVGRFTDRDYGESLGSTGHHSKAIYAFKFYDEEYETELLDIEWSMGRTGQITPVAIYKDIDIEGSICNRASLHNISVLYDTLHIPFEGQKIKIFKANMIIPQVSWAEDAMPEADIEVPEVCPICGKPTEVKDNDGVKTLWCTNSNCEGKLINVIDHFVGKKGLDVKGLSKATIEKLIENGWINRRADIFQLYDKQKEWENLSGFGPKSVSNVLGAIEAAKNTNFESYLSSLGIPLIGRTISKELAKRFNSYNDFREAIREEFDFSTLNGFGYEMNKSLKDYDYTEADEIAEMLTFNDAEEQPASAENLPFKNKIFVITGRLQLIQNREKLINIVERNGGKVSSSISNKTSVLINNDINSNSTKNKKAKELNIPIITEEDFLKQCIIKE